MGDEWRLSEECAAEFQRREAWEELTNPAGKTPLYHADSSARYSDRLAAWLAASSQSLLPGGGGAAPASPPGGGRDASPPPRSQASSSTPKAGWDRLVEQQEAEQLRSPTLPAAAPAANLLPPPGLRQAAAAPPELEPTPPDSRPLSPNGKRRGRRKRGRRRNGSQPGQPEAAARQPQPAVQPPRPAPPPQPQPPAQRQRERTWPLREVVADQPWVKVWQPVPSVEALGWPEVERWGNDWIAAEGGDGAAATLEPNAFLQPGYWTRDG